MALSYNSGSGNGTWFGLECGAIIHIKKDGKKLPEYNDAEASDLLIFSGAED